MEEKLADTLDESKTNGLIDDEERADDEEEEVEDEIDELSAAVEWIDPMKNTE